MRNFKGRFQKKVKKPLTLPKEFLPFLYKFSKDRVCFFSTPMVPINEQSLKYFKTDQRSANELAMDQVKKMINMDPFGKPWVRKENTL